MQVSYRFCEVDPITWCDKRVIETVVEDSTEINFNLSLETRGIMKSTIGEDVGECYIRVYIIMDGVPDCLGTFLAQTQSKQSDGLRDSFGHNIQNWEVDAYTPLLELKDDMPNIGFSLVGGTVRGRAAEYASAHMRAPIASDNGGAEILQPVVAAIDDTWLTYLSALLAKDGYRFMVERTGTITLAPVRNAESMQPVYRFTDDTASIIQPDVTEVRDLYGVPNVVEVVPSSQGSSCVAIARNDNPDSSASTVARGRIVRHRETSPALPDGYSDKDVSEYADRLLAEKSSITRTIKFTHDYLKEVNVGDCVYLDFDRSNIHTKAVVQSQKITCNTEAQVVCEASYMEVA